jgi:hypothetical protein
MRGTDQPSVELGSKLNSGRRPLAAPEAVEAEVAASQAAEARTARLSAGPPGR